MLQKTYRYQLDKSSKKHACPRCRKKRFVLYVDRETSQYLDSTVGRCDREENCQYHYTPKQFFTDNPLLTPNADLSFVMDALPPPIDLSFIANKYLAKSMAQYTINPFVIWLYTLFDKQLVDDLIQQFYIGTSKMYNGAVVFWQIDTDLKIRQAKVMHYNKKTGRRNKEAGAFFMGKNLLKREGVHAPNLVQCLYGLHQLNTENNNTIAIVESEKTAILMTAFSSLGLAPKYTWMATGGKNGVKWKEQNTWKTLKNRKVILFPDLGVGKEWRDKAKYIGTYVQVSDLLIKASTTKQRKQGLDVADFFLDYWSKQYLHDASVEINLNEYGYPTQWNKPFAMLKNENVKKMISTFDLIRTS